jgi:hypothetical protein
MSYRRKITWLCLIVAAAGIKIFSFFPGAVETVYSRSVYPVVARTQRILFGWIPFSVGDILYAAAALLLLYRLFLLIRRIRRRELKRGWLFRGVRQTVFVALWVYVVFNLLWGLNYNRLGIADQLQLTITPYTKAELNELTEVLLEQLNDLSNWPGMHREELAKMGTLRAGAVRAYDSLGSGDPRFAYRSPSVKASLFSYPGLYVGFAGYYNPFTGEAQVNTDDPVFGQPFTTCHEMGHQLGYAKENEANFIGFLAARESPDPDFQYSVYLELFLYAYRELYARDSTLARPYRDQLTPVVKGDLRTMKRFNLKYANPLEPVIWKLYGQYLHANRQPQGIVTYSEVTAWLIAYARKNGRESIKTPEGGPRPKMLRPPGEPF